MLLTKWKMSNPVTIVMAFKTHNTNTAVSTPIDVNHSSLHHVLRGEP